MHHPKSKFPNYQDVSREEASQIFAPHSGMALLSLAKIFRGQDGVIGNAGPIPVRRTRVGALPSKGAQVRGGIPRREQHGRGFRCCSPRAGRPRKPYNRAAEKWR